MRSMTSDAAKADDDDKRFFYRILRRVAEEIPIAGQLLGFQLSGVCYLVRSRINSRDSIFCRRGTLPPPSVRNCRNRRRGDA